MSSNRHAKRVITGLIMATIAVFCLVSGGMALLALLSIFVFVGAREYVQILENKGFYPSLKIILFADVVFAIIAYLSRFDLVPIAFTVGTLSAFLWVLFRGRQPYIANVSTTILGFVYSGWFPLHLIFLRDLNYAENLIKPDPLRWNVQNEGLGYVLLMFTVIILTDIGCYYFGKKFGKHKLSPVISPNKTIEGSIGGALCAIAGAFIVSYFIGLPWYHTLIVAFLMTTFAQLGDLAESLIKRDAGVKDSGDSLPGHGGFLDRTDSFIFTIPITYYYFKYFVVSDTLWLDFVKFFKGIF